MIVFSLNVGLLRRLGGLLQPTPFVEPRFAALANALRSISADIVALQELYEDGHWARIVEVLSNEYPYSIRGGRRPWPLLSSGLGILSRYPLAGDFVPFSGSLWDERLIVQKGVLVGHTTDATSHRVAIVNTHTTAGGALGHPEDARTDRVRAGQVRQLIDLVEAIPGIAIVMGDMNAGPGVSESNYSMFEEAGWVDVYRMVARSAGLVTWDPLNPLNQRGPHRNCPPQRIDHIFLRGRDLRLGKVQIASSEVVLREPCVSVGAGSRVTVSDHYGVTAKLLLRDF